MAALSQSVSSANVTQQLQVQNIPHTQMYSSDVAFVYQLL